MKTCVCYTLYLFLSSGYLYAYVSYLNTDACLLLLTPHTDQFFALHDCKKRIVEVSHFLAFILLLFLFMCFLLFFNVENTVLGARMYCIIGLPDLTVFIESHSLYVISFP